MTLPVRAPACTSMSQAYSSVSLPAGKPSAENIAWARICRPERLRCPSHNTPSTAGRYTIKRSQNGRNDQKTVYTLNKADIHFTEVTSIQPGSCRWQRRVVGRGWAATGFPCSPSSSQSTNVPDILSDHPDCHCCNAVMQRQIFITIHKDTGFIRV